MLWIKAIKKYNLVKSKSYPLGYFIINILDNDIKINKDGYVDVSVDELIDCSLDFKEIVNLLNYYEDEIGRLAYDNNGLRGTINYYEEDIKELKVKNENLKEIIKKLL